MSLRRVYETTIIINAALEDPDVDAAINKITSYLENHGGVIEEQNKWGRRRLAYPINKKSSGYYVHLVFNSNPSTVPALERFLTLDETILRHLTLHLDNELREYRKERSLSEGKSGETLITSVTEDVATVRANSRAIAASATGENIPIEVEEKKTKISTDEITEEIESSTEEVTAEVTE